VTAVFQARVFLNHSVVFLNIILLCLAGGGLTYYISEANIAASGRYRISFLRNQIAHLIEKQSILTTQKSVTENPATVAVFAQNQNMVEAKDIIYIFENNNVALQR
jgi:hypothetical protein